MLVIYNSVILKNGYLSIMTEDMRDTLILPSSSFNLLRQFFILQGFLDSDCYAELAIIEDDFDILNGKLFYQTQYIMDNVRNVAVLDMLVLRGIIFINLILNDCDYCLTVLSLDKRTFIGVVASGHSVKSSVDLSRLILSIPEIDWQV